MDIKSIGAALALVKAKLTGVDDATRAANTAASSANTAATRANTAASGAEGYASQYTSIVQKQSLDDADLRLLYTVTQARLRACESRITTLEQQVAAMAGK